MTRDGRRPEINPRGGTAAVYVGSARATWADGPSPGTDDPLPCDVLRRFLRSQLTVSAIIPPREDVTRL